MNPVEVAGCLDEGWSPSLLETTVAVERRESLLDTVCEELVRLSVLSTLDLSALSACLRLLPVINVTQLYTVTRYQQRRLPVSN